MFSGLVQAKDHYRKDFSKPQNEIGSVVGIGQSDYEHLKQIVGDRGGHKAEESHRVRAPAPMAAIAANYGLVPTIRKRSDGDESPSARLLSPKARTPAPQSPTAKSEIGGLLRGDDTTEPPDSPDSPTGKPPGGLAGMLGKAKAAEGGDAAAVPTTPPLDDGGVPFEIKTRRQRLYEDRLAQISDYAGRKRFIDFCTEFLDVVRSGDFTKSVRMLDTIQQVDRARDESSPGGRTFFQQTRLLNNQEKNYKTYDDALFEVVNYIDPRNQFTALLWACMHDNHRIADLLLTVKADPQVQHPLKKCVIWNRPRCAEVLIRHGADKLQRDEKGKIPFEYLGSKRIQNLGLGGSMVTGNSAKNKRLEARVFDLASQKAAEKNLFLDDDHVFMKELLKPTEEDFIFMEKKQREAELRPVKLWAGCLEETSFVQDLTEPPHFFVITADKAVDVQNSTGGRAFKAMPGTIWQQLAIEPVPGEPLQHWIKISNGLHPSSAQLAGNTNASYPTSGWVLWDRRQWHHEATRLGISGTGKSSKTLHKEMSMAMVNMNLASAQQSDAWRSVPAMMPIQIFNSTYRKIVTPKGAVPIKARSGPTLANCCIVHGPPYKFGENVLCSGQIVLDGGWVFYQVKTRNYGSIGHEKPGSGWICARAKDYVTVVLKT
ncbi:unnamed protein product [Amoebophrya sp. A25]|nr:unnamed protein product [Amoebophrya sp. A25]|eukprot:GSA25T00005483001.1